MEGFDLEILQVRLSIYDFLPSLFEDSWKELTICGDWLGDSAILKPSRQTKAEHKTLTAIARTKDIDIATVQMQQRGRSDPRLSLAQGFSRSVQGQSEFVGQENELSFLRLRGRGPSYRLMPNVCQSIFVAA